MPLRPEPADPGATRPRHVLVLRAGAIGDFILTLPALAALRAAFPDARLSLVANAAVGPLALASGHADVVYPFDEGWVSHLFDESGSPSPLLRERLADVDLAVVWLRRPDGPVADNLRSLGIRTLAAPSFPAPEARRHVADHLASTLAPLGISVGEARPRLDLPGAARALADAFWRRNGLAGGAPVVALHPGSGGARKNWAPERFALVADRLEEDGARVLLVAGPADEAPVAAVRRTLRVARPVDGCAAGLVELAAILGRCAAYLGNDSGVSHLSAAVGTPTVAVFGPTDPAVWAPRGDVTVLWRGPECPSGGQTLASTEAADRRYLDLVGVDEVVKAVKGCLP